MATQRKDGRFTVSKRIQGNKVYGYGPTPEAAAEDLDRKVNQYIRSTPDPKETLHSFAKRSWFPTLEHLAPLSKKKYTAIYRNYIREYLGMMPIQEIGFPEIQTWINHLTKLRIKVEGKPDKRVGAPTIRFAKGTLGTILNQAVQQDIVHRNVTVGVKMPKASPKRERVLGVEEAMKLLEAVKGTDLSAPVFLACVLGLRRGEIAGLKWDDLDRRRGELKIQRQRQAIRPGTGVIDRELKTTGSRRTLRLPNTFIAEIDARGDLDSEYICTRLGKPWVPDSLTEDWINERDYLGLEGWTFHDLRHGSAGLLHAAGCDLVQIAAVLGHASPDMSWLYTSISEKSRGESIEKLAGILGMN